MEWLKIVEIIILFLLVVVIARVLDGFLNRLREKREAERKNRKE